MTLETTLTPQLLRAAATLAHHGEFVIAHRVCPERGKLAQWQLLGETEDGQAHLRNWAGGTCEAATETVLLTREQAMRLESVARLQAAAQISR